MTAYKCTRCGSKAALDKPSDPKTVKRMCSSDTCDGDYTTWKKFSESDNDAGVPWT